MRQDTAAPAISDGVLHIAECFVKVLALGDNGQIVPPRNLCDLVNRLLACLLCKLGNSLLPNLIIPDYKTDTTV
jgi:hypothetical protein